jgi:hypothetical protein
MGTATKTKQPLNEVEPNCGEDSRSVYARMRLRVCMECACVWGGGGGGGCGYLEAWVLAEHEPSECDAELATNDDQDPEVAVGSELVVQFLHGHGWDMGQGTDAAKEGTEQTQAHM